MRCTHGTAIVLMLLAGACSSAKLPERYAHCTDLGTLRLAAPDADAAEDRMRMQVAILGGDLLLFNGIGHAENAGRVPPVLTQRRNVLAVRPAESINGKQPELVALQASVAQTGIADTEQDLWYYGVALNCGRNED